MRNQNGFTAIEILFTLGCLSIVALGCGVFYVGIHFLMKVW